MSRLRKTQALRKASHDRDPLARALVDRASLRDLLGRLEQWLPVERAARAAAVERMVRETHPAVHAALREGAPRGECRFCAGGEHG